MKVILNQDNFYLIRLYKGEEAFSELKHFFASQNFGSAVFEAIGAATKLELGFYDLEKREYVKKVLEEDFEAAPLIGNIARMGDEVIVHAHGSFGREDLSTVSGHVFSLVVGGTLEVALRVFENRAERALDEETGLNLLESKSKFQNSNSKTNSKF